MAAHARLNLRRTKSTIISWYASYHFRFLDLVDTSDGIWTFVSLCFLVRVCLAIGCTSLNNAGFVMLLKAFPNDIATVFVSCRSTTHGRNLYMWGKRYIVCFFFCFFFFMFFPQSCLALWSWPGEESAALHEYASLAFACLPCMRYFFVFFTSSLCRGSAADCDCGTPWAFFYLTLLMIM